MTAAFFVKNVAKVFRKFFILETKVTSPSAETFLSSAKYEFMIKEYHNEQTCRYVEHYAPTH